MKASLTRNNTLCKNIVFVDGMWGTGKSILAPVLGSLNNVENQNIHHIFEYICTLLYQGKIYDDAAKVLIKTYADILIFNSQISREINLRPFDDSGLFNNPNAFRNIKRLFKDGNEKTVEHINKNKPILQIMTHNISPVSAILLESFENIKIVKMVRHPVYMAEHWFNYIERVGTDLREFTITCDNNGLIPWFAQDIPNYLKLCTMDKVISSMHSLITLEDRNFKDMSTSMKSNILTIPFESFVLNPTPWIKSLEIHLNTKSSKTTKKILKKQKCPRKFIHDGKGHASYGFKKENLKMNEKEDYDRRLNYIKSKASNKLIDKLFNLTEKYINDYKFPRNINW